MLENQNEPALLEPRPLPSPPPPRLADGMKVLMPPEDEQVKSLPGIDDDRCCPNRWRAGATV